jgi:molecular chaperone DnaK (HSP70)
VLWARLISLFAVNRRSKAAITCPGAWRGPGGRTIKRVVCIDFGTALSKASLRGNAGDDHGPALPLRIGAAAGGGAENAFLAPSVLFVDGGRIHLGESALQRAQANAAREGDPILSFKSILAARDVKEALRAPVPASIDRSGAFCYRDLLVLYLAFIMRRAREALTEATGETKPDISWRYTSPVWRSHEAAMAAFSRIFGEADYIAASVGPLLTSDEGISIAHARHVIDSAHGAAPGQLVEREVFEAHAAGHAYARLCPSPHNIILVCDIGAGTTDFAGFEIEGAGPSASVRELLEVRQCVAVAGDEIDNILIEVAQRKAPSKSRAAVAEIWRSLRLGARRAKRDLFTSGRCELMAGSRRIRVRRAELEQHPLFKELKDALMRACRTSLGPVINRAMERNRATVGVLLAGGGAHLPFLPALIQRTAGSAPLEIIQFDQTWPAVPEAVQSALPQVAISMGGALAEDALAEAAS